jgi:hypothetical protein
MNAESKPKPTTSFVASPMAIVGAILAQGVIRLCESKDSVDKLTEESVHTGVLTTQENTLE